jgi:HlyD family secretion protein
VLVAWACVAQLDIVAVASGRLVPQTYVKVVQPADAGIVREILVEEGDAVEEGQVLVRLDSTKNSVDRAAIERELAIQRLQLRRIEAELADAPMKGEAADDPLLFAQVEAQRRNRSQAFIDSIGQEKAARERSANELAAAREGLEKREVTLPSYLQWAKAYEDLAARKLVGELEAIERRRQALEASQDLESQRSTVAALEAAIVEHEQRLAQLRSQRASDLSQARVEAVSAVNRLEQQLGKLQFEEQLLELRASQAGVVKELATTTLGAVVQPGTVLVSLVPRGEPLWAEVLIESKDIGFVARNQPVRIKLDAYQFQKYGIAEGVVRTVSADSSEPTGAAREQQPSHGPTFKALVELKEQRLWANGLDLPLAAGMQVSAEIIEGKRTVMEYLLSPVQRVAAEAGTER